MDLRAEESIEFSLITEGGMGREERKEEGEEIETSEEGSCWRDKTLEDTLRFKIKSLDKKS